jgi:CRP-like cAMP-binding protein
VRKIKNPLSKGVYPIKRLTAIPLFSGLTDEHIEKIDQMATTRTYKANEIIFHEGDRGDGFYMVETGKIKVFKLSFEGKEQILHIYGPGHMFGEVPAFSGQHFPASAMALERSTIIFLPRNKFVDLISKMPGLAMNLLGDLSMRLREFTVQIENLSLKEVPARLAAYILILSEEHDHADRVTLPISKAQLANLIGTTPETVSRVFKKMTAAGLIRVQAKDIHIQSLDGLTDLAESGTLK